MALREKLKFGTVLPHRSSSGPVAVAEIKNVAVASEQAGFDNIWVTENTLDDAFSFEPFAALTYAAAATKRIGLGVAVVVLTTHSPIHVAHSAATLDYFSNGRALLGIGLGRPDDYRDFQIPMERRVGRFNEAVHLMKALWTEERVNYKGDFYQLADVGIALKPVQKPHVPLWFGGGHPNALKRAVMHAQGWIGGGAQPIQDFRKSVLLIQEALAETGRPASEFAISKRVFIAVDANRAVARAKLERWFVEVYKRPELTETAGIYGTPSEVRGRLQEFVEMGATHVLLNPAGDYQQQVQLLAGVIDG